MDKYTSYYPKKGEVVLPYVTMWVATSTFVKRERDPNDEWDIGDEGEELEDYGVVLDGGEIQPRRGYYPTRSRSLTEEELGFMPKAGDDVFMVIEVYGDGCTFGNQSPLYKPMKIFKTYYEAEAWKTSPEGNACKDDGYFGGHKDYIIEKVMVRR